VHAVCFLAILQLMDIVFVKMKGDLKMGVKVKDLYVGCPVLVYGYRGKIVRVLNEGADIEVGGVIERYYELDEIEKDEERIMQHTANG
jgi:hypothetical protein